jgi:hypothetical protein
LENLLSKQLETALTPIDELSLPLQKIVIQDIISTIEARVQTMKRIAKA